MIDSRKNTVQSIKEIDDNFQWEKINELIKVNEKKRKNKQSYGDRTERWEKKFLLIPFCKKKAVFVW